MFRQNHVGKVKSYDEENISLILTIKSEAVNAIVIKTVDFDVFSEPFVTSPAIIPLPMNIDVLEENTSLF